MSETSKNGKPIKVGSRRSELALIQTEHVISLLKEAHPDRQFEVVTMSTLGDRILDVPLPKIGEKSLFTKELETALATGCVDFVVHSLKDLPTALPPDMAIGAVLERERPNDALVLRKDSKEEGARDLGSLPKDSVVGTSSLRRAAQIHRKYPHLKVENIRGNLNTRLKKLDEADKYHAIVLAVAGLYRMGWNDRISKVIDSDDILYAVGQGALAVECRENDQTILELLRPLYNVPTAIRVIAERTFLRTLGGGCSAPVAIRTNLKSKDETSIHLSMTGGVWSLDGSEQVTDSDSCDLEMNTSELKCSKCPSRKKEVSNSSCSSVSCKEDIECLQSCKVNCKRQNLTECPYQPKKKIKLSEEDKNGITKHENDSDLDPHEHCPVHLSVGVDFMGKCPFLESEVVSKCPVSGKILGKTLDVNKCPFIKDGKLKIVLENNTVESEQNVENCNLFCGLVPHPNVSLKVFKQAEDLGSRLAQQLISRGASKIMAKAQASIRGN